MIFFVLWICLPGTQLYYGNFVLSIAAAVRQVFVLKKQLTSCTFFLAGK